MNAVGDYHKKDTSVVSEWASSDLSICGEAGASGHLFVTGQLGAADEISTTGAQWLWSGNSRRKKDHDRADRL